ncbi:MAG: hypothetical protein SCH70_01765 [Candidatus Methanoperedens sp.]|nr:hypothetical protein [Candidatus Methanoperedens sp.]
MMESDEDFDRLDEMILEEGKKSQETSYNSNHNSLNTFHLLHICEN